MNVEPLTTLIHEQGLVAHQDLLLAYVRPAICLKLGQKLEPEMGQPGQSRIGGMPDLPSSMPWPKSALLDRYRCFILQINLADLPNVPETPLPSQGMLYLFADENEDSADQVVFYDGDEPLQPVHLPEDALFITDWYEDLVAHHLEFDLFPDLPQWATSDFYALCDRLQCGEEQLEKLGQTVSKPSVGKLLGHVSGIGHDPREDAYVVREVNPAWLYNYEQRSTLDMTQAQHWCNLLEVDSSRMVNLMFGDAGYLQILIHHEDLRQHTFSRLYVNLQSS